MWYAKRTGGYTQNSQEFVDNVWEAYYLLIDSNNLSGTAWTLEAICGMLGNAYAESGMNPWRYNGTAAYGLVQFNPPSYYIGGAGVSYNGYAPSLDPTLPEGDFSDGANASDGRAQLLVVDNPSGTKYSSSGIRWELMEQLDWTLQEWNDIQSFKLCDSLEEATQAFLLFYEFPFNPPYFAQDVRVEYLRRKPYADKVYEVLTGTPPVPPTPTRHKGMPLYFYMGKKFKQKKGIRV